jgi:hypothetical protein
MCMHEVVNILIALAIAGFAVTGVVLFFRDC